MNTKELQSRRVELSKAKGHRKVVFCFQLPCLGGFDELLSYIGFALEVQIGCRALVGDNRVIVQLDPLMLFRQMQIPAPKLSQEFELLCFDLFRLRWEDPNAQLNGRGGQEQHGVDLFGKPSDGRGYWGVQCKVKDRSAGAKLTIREIKAEVERAGKFVPKLDHLVLATTAGRDARVQEEVRLLSESRKTSGQFSVSVLAWEDIVISLDQYPEVMSKHYPFLRSGETERTRGGAGEISTSVRPGSSTDLATRQLSARLSDVVNRLNERSAEPRLSPARIAQEMGFPKISALTRILDGTDEPSLDWLKLFSHRYGINFNWLVQGTEQPFYHESLHVFGPSEVAAIIAETSPKEVFFVRAQSPRGECTLVLKYTDWRFNTAPNPWHVSSIVGGTGSSHLVELYHLIVNLREQDVIQCHGQVLPLREFERLVEGTCFPGAVLEFPHSDHDWWYAFPDIDHKLHSAPHYRDWYGQSFLDAQAIVRERLRRNGELP